MIQVRNVARWLLPAPDQPLAHEPRPALDSRVLPRHAAAQRTGRALCVNPMPGVIMNPLSMLKHPSAFLPVVMSTAALAAALSFLATHGPAPQADEGTAAHIWQILMVTQLPIVIVFAARWIRRSPRQALLILGLQIAAALAAMAPVYLNGW